MWMFTQKNFLSVVAYDPKFDRAPNSPFKQYAASGSTHLLIRARLREDLEDIKRVLPSAFIDDQPSADYRFRMVIPRKKYKQYLALSVDELTYDSHFKEQFRDNAPQGKARYGALMSVWSRMAEFQPTPPYGGFLGGSGGGSLWGSKYSDKPTFGHSFRGAELAPAAHDVAEDLLAAESVEEALWNDDSAFLQDYLAEADERAARDFEWVDETEDDGTVPYLSLDKAYQILLDRAAISFTSEEVEGLGDDAFELYQRLAEKYGIGVTVTRSQIKKIRCRLDSELAKSGGTK